MGILYPAVPVAVAIAIFTILARHALEMRTKQNYREMWGAIFLGILPAVVFCFFVGIGEPSMLVRNYLLIPAGAIIGAVVFAYLGYVFADMRAARARFDVSQVVPNTQGPVIDQSVRSYNQQGGITAHSVTVAPLARSLDAPENTSLKQQILTQLARDKDITVMALMGDTESIDFAMQIHAFLKNNGFKLREPNGVSQGVFTQAQHGLNFNTDTNTLVVGAR
jgi:hypothetical protein